MTCSGACNVEAAKRLSDDATKVRAGDQPRVGWIEPFGLHIAIARREVGAMFGLRALLRIALGSIVGMAVVGGLLVGWVKWRTPGIDLSSIDWWGTAGFAAIMLPWLAVVILIPMVMPQSVRVSSWGVVSGVGHQMGRVPAERVRRIALRELARGERVLTVSYVDRRGKRHRVMLGVSDRLDETRLLAVIDQMSRGRTP